MNHELLDTINIAKRSCNRCYIQKTFKQDKNEKEAAQKACKRVVDLFREEFDMRRRMDETTNQQIENLKIAKSICLDAFDECVHCDRSAPRMKNILMQIKN